MMITICCSIGVVCGAQDKDNYIALTANSINFNLNSTTALEAEQVISNALTLTVASKQYSYSVSVRVNNRTASTATPIPVSNLGIRLNTKSSSTGYADYSTKYLASTDQIIASDSKSNKDDIYNYDLVLTPIGYNIMPGTYSFTLLFTMTQP